MNRLLCFKKYFPLVSGVLIIFSFPPFNVGFLAWVAMVPLLASLYLDDFYLGFAKGFVYGFFLNLGILYWLGVNQGTYWYFSMLSMISGVLFLAIFYGLAVSVVGYIGRRAGKSMALFAFPFVFVAMEWLRSLGTMGFTWNSLCYTQSPYLALMQIVSVVGPFGLSLWVYGLNTLIFVILAFPKEVRWRFVSIFAILFLFPIFFGGLVLLGSGRGLENDWKITATVVQPNVDPNEKWSRENYQSNMDLLYDLSRREIINHDTDLLVWPETAVPTYLRINRRNSLMDIYNFLKENNTVLITGAPDYSIKDKQYEYYNSVFYLNNKNSTPETYRKIRLVPFGEYIPFSETFEDLKKLNLGQGNFIAGDEITVFKYHRNDYDIHMTAAVCFESSFSSLIRQGVKQGSQLLAVVTNDSWFGNTSAPYLHGQIARFRAVENRIPVVRAANTGISMIIDKYGRVLKKSRFNEKTALTEKVAIGREKTFYSKTGNWIGVLCVITMFLLVIVTFFGRKNEK
ncbi:MAG: apolipoprotein N-acyltransferase [Candidatus Marinimicrobia bacterium]|nr:apolipoprotein N-acyltransferase [Candidatus Neomarinimicrobiota bacterium]